MDQRITVLHIAECAGGVERYIQMLLPRLEKKGFCQFFLCSYNYNKANYQGMVDGVKQMDLKQTFSPLQVLRKVLSILLSGNTSKSSVRISCIAIAVLPED